MVAAELGIDVDAVKLLLTAGANVNTSPRSGVDAGLTSLMLAAQGDSDDCVKVLLAAGADVNAQDRVLLRTALMRAADNGAVEPVRILIAAGASANARDDDGGCSELGHSRRTQERH